jgi:hypothetical protein
MTFTLTDRKGRFVGALVEPLDDTDAARLMDCG